ncbi:MAG: InlB B-repeat-containing protein, partial [Clostridia bacterium]|nr:InlB B-repeat-containing protein [Clostridia bacterium]
FYIEKDDILLKRVNDVREGKYDYFDDVDRDYYHKAGMSKEEIKRRHKTLKTSHIIMAFIAVLMFLSISYAAFSTTLRINGTVTGEQQELSVIYLHIDNSSSYPSTIKYMETYSYTFINPPTIESVTMGGTQLELNTDYTYENGTLTIPDVTGNLVIDGEVPELQDFSIKYVYGDNIEFDGKSRLDTGIALFSNDNFERDFEMTVKIDSNTYDSTQNSGYNTLINCVDHDVSPWHGFLLRRNSSKYIFKVTNAQNTVTETNPSLSEVQNVLIARQNKKLYADLTNGSNLSEVGDFSNYTERINSTLLIGSDINNANAPNRCFVGQLSNITVKNYYKAEEAPVTLPSPSRTGYIFKGWYADSAFTQKIGDGAQIYTPRKENNTLYAKWLSIDDIEEEQEYVFNGQYNFAQQGYINTYVYLYTSNNIHKNFEMSFDIVDLGSSSNDDTLMSATKNILKIKNITNKLLKLETIGNTASSSVDNIPSTVTNVRIIRINDKLYYSFNGQSFLLINDYTNSTSYSDNPVIFGADFKADGTVYRNFDGILSNMSVKFISDSATLSDYDTPTGQLATVYSHSGEYVFDGTNYIDTNVKLFDYDSYDKDFEISFNIVSIDSDVSTQGTLVNSKYENKSAGYPGFVYILTSDKKRLEFTAATATSGSPNIRNVSDVHSVKISRKDMKIYLKINDEEEKQLYDFSGF